MHETSDSAARRPRRDGWAVVHASEVPPVRVADLLVVGSGAAALSTAVSAAAEGLDVVLLEKERVLGGSTAWSAGVMWIPNSPMAVAAGKGEAPQDALDFLRSELGEPVFTQQRGRIEAYLSDGPEVLRFLQAGMGSDGRRFDPLVFEVDGELPDFRAGMPSSPHAREGWRCVRASAFNAYRLQKTLALLRRPLDVLTIAGMGIEMGADLRHFQNAPHSWASLRYVLCRVLVHLLDLLCHGRGMHLVNGNALAARLLLAARQLGVELRTSAAVHSLQTDAGGRVVGVRLQGRGGAAGGELRARHGVVLACGGFPHDTERKRRLLPHAPTGLEHHSAAPPANTGDGLRLGESVGGVVRPLPAAGALWAPVSLASRPDGTTAVYPHLVERGKPGLLAVTRHAERFCDEALPYHDFVAKWFEATPADAPPQAWLVCDLRFLFFYGLGAIKPYLITPPWWPWWSGYVRWSFGIEGLARKCGLDAARLRAAVEAVNADALADRDTRFRKGESVYDVSQGDPHKLGNPCIGTIRHAPYFALRLHPGSLGTFAGLGTDVDGRVLGSRHRPIAGLYACGNDMSAVLAGFDPANGMTLGAAMIFGRRCALAVAAEAAASSSPARSDAVAA